VQEPSELSRSINGAGALLSMPYANGDLQIQTVRLMGLWERIHIVQANDGGGNQHIQYLLCIAADTCNAVTDCEVGRSQSIYTFVCLCCRSLIDRQVREMGQ